MAIERSLFFYDGTAYDITATQNYIHRMFERHREFHRFTFDAIISSLSDCRFDVSQPGFIPDPITGTLIESGIWFEIYGIEDETVVWDEGKENVEDNDSVLTFDLGEAELMNEELGYEADEPIDAFEEAEFVDAAHALMDLLDENPQNPI